MVKLQLGKPSNGTLKISTRSWAKLVAAAKPVATVPLPQVPPVNRTATARAMFIQWLVISGLFGSFIYLSSRSQPDGFSPVFAMVVPGFLGVAMLFRFVRS